jgi:hypothetical protein
LRSNTKSYGDKAHQTDSQNSDTTARSGRELHHLQFSLQAVNPETFGYTLVHDFQMLDLLPFLDDKMQFYGEIFSSVTLSFHISGNGFDRTRNHLITKLV